MNYKIAVQKETETTKIETRINDGWVHLTKYGIYKTPATEQMIQHLEEKVRNESVQRRLEKLSNMFIEYKIQDLKRENYNDDEIEIIIENMLSLNDEEEVIDSEYDSDESNDSI